MTTSSLNIITYNIKGINNPIKRKKILGQLKKMHCSIALLQETHLSEIEHLKLKREWVDQVYSASCGGGKKRGVAILFNKTVYYNNEKVFCDVEGRYVMVVGTIGGLKITILNVYAPNEDCPHFFKKIAHLLAECGEGLVLIGGDFNCVVNNKLDKLPITTKPQCRMSKSLTNMIKELGLVDVWRLLHPSERDFTFMSQVHGSYSRLDYFLTLKKDAFRIKDSTIEPMTISDHSPVTVNLDLGLENHTKYWRINVSLLADIHLREEIRSAITEYFALNDDGNVSPTVLWDAGKATIRGKLISIGSRLKKERLKRQLELETEIKRLENEHKQHGRQATLDKLKGTRTKLDELLTYKAEGALRFTNRKYYEMGNKASRLLAFQLKKAQSSRVVPKIKHVGVNKIETSPKGISDTFAEYYGQLYKGQVEISKMDKIQEFFKTLKMDKLTEGEAARLIESIKESEIRETISKLKNSKSPGMDGFAGEYYKTFVDDLSPILCKLYNYVLDSGNPPESWSKAIITVLHKDGKDPLQCSSYRPISLLCVDYKILTSILASRIQKHIKKLIKPDQTGFVSGRQGTNNIRRALNLQSIMAKDKHPSMLLSLDAEKAFDRVDWLFLEHTLIEMGFGEKFVKWFNLLYKNPVSTVRVNGHCSSFFKVERGVRQGDSLSPVLFALSIEPLAEAIRQNTQVQGITDGDGTIHKIALFADDVLLFIKHPNTSVPALMQCLDIYAKVSGYKINHNKSEAMMISGKWPEELSKTVSFHWSNKGFRYLGIILTPHPSKLFDANYAKLIKQLKNDLTRWEVLPLSLFGRVETIRMNLLPRLLFLFQSLPVRVPISIFNTLNKLISQFLWQHKRPRIKLKTLYLPKDKGGLALPNLKHYFWAAQLSAIVTWIGGDEESIWNRIEQNETRGVSLSTLPFIDSKSVIKLKIGNEWIKHTLKVWTEVKKMLNDIGSISRAMPIVGNIDFPPSTWDHGFRGWATKGLITLNQLFGETGFKSFSQIKEQFDLSINDMYRYFQIRHYIMSHKEKERIGKDPNAVEDYFITIIEKKFPTKKHVSNLYKRLSLDVTQNTWNIKEKWELELNILIEDELWDNLCKGSHTGINSQSWKEFDWKLKVRYFHTPLVISNFVKDPSAALCWRNCGKVGDHTHIFWDCPVIQVYWKNVKEELENILGMEVPSSPLFYLLGAMSNDIFSANQSYIVRILLLVAKKTITVNWKTIKSPTISEWKQRVKQVYIMEHMTSILQMNTDLFKQRWSCVEIHLVTS